MNFYITAVEGLPKMLLEIENPMGNFKRATYEGAFRRYCEQHRATLEAMENGYVQALDKEQYLINMADALVQAAEGQLKQKTKKNQRENLLLDFNFCLAVYVYPAVQEFHGEVSEAFVEQMSKAWKEAYPKTNVIPATFEQINGGFRRKFCYITTAVCTTMGKPDDCYELNRFRNFRDEYLMRTAEGEAIVREYYDIAPTIVKHIGQKTDSCEIYQGIWDKYLNPCLQMIEQERNEECEQLYMKMVRDLEKEYFIS